MNHSLIHILPEIQQALEQGKPVVALESTIISHGMPYPKNVETAIAVEDMVRANGAIPATIAIMDGKCYVGLTEKQLEFFGNAQGVWKVSLRDIPYVLSKKLNGATTVAATMRIAGMACIKIFVTGGTGGVHRGAGSSMDISADLTEMAQTSVAVTWPSTRRRCGSLCCGAAVSSTPAPIGVFKAWAASGRSARTWWSFRTVRRSPCFLPRQRHGQPVPARKRA